MIDTITVSPSLTPYASLDELLKNEDTNYVFSARNTHHSQSGQDKSRAWGQDTSKSVRFGFDEDKKINRVEGNLPKLLDAARGNLKPSNGIQIKTQAEFDAGVSALLFELIKLCGNVSCSDLPISRIDLVLNLHLNPREVLPLMRHARHPMVRRETETYRNDGSSWKSNLVNPFENLNTVRFSGTKTVITLYDKVRQLLSKQGKTWPDETICVRVEVQLKGKAHIAKAFGQPEANYITLDEVNFENCYHVFRSILCQFDHVGKLPLFKPNLVNLLATHELYPECWGIYGGMSPLEWYRTTSKVTDKTFKEMRRQVRRAVMELKQFNWHEILHPTQLPDLVDIDHKGRETFIPSPWGWGR